MFLFKFTNEGGNFVILKHGVTLISMFGVICVSIMFYFMALLPLNLPLYSFRFKEKDGKRLVFDRLRKKYVALTPEEWVRQNVIEFLVNEKSFPAARIGNEISLRQNGLIRRCDSVVYDTFGMPLLIAEYKAPAVEITQSVFDQIARYVWELKVEYLLVSNGMKHFCCHLDYESMQMSYLREIPVYQDICRVD